MPLDAVSTLPAGQPVVEDIQASLPPPSFPSFAPSSSSAAAANRTSDTSRLYDEDKTCGPVVRPIASGIDQQKDRPRHAPSPRPCPLPLPPSLPPVLDHRRRQHKNNRAPTTRCCLCFQTPSFLPIPSRSPSSPPLPLPKSPTPHEQGRQRHNAYGLCHHPRLHRQEEGHCQQQQQNYCRSRWEQRAGKRQCALLLLCGRWP